MIETDCLTRQQIGKMIVHLKDGVPVLISIGNLILALMQKTSMTITLQITVLVVLIVLLSAL